MKRSDWILLLLGLALFGFAIFRIQDAERDLAIIQLPHSNPPTTVITPFGNGSEMRPTILVGHGFAGSKLLMRGFSLSLAHAGYTVVAWDFDGHGTNPQPYPLRYASEVLLENAEAALRAAQSAGYASGSEIAILGHSMGSGVALDYGVDHPETQATIAVSPIRRKVTPDFPRNLLLLAGSLEREFVETAEELLMEAGGAGNDPENGTGRALIVIDGVEHISILFDPDSHAAARAWLDRVFGPQPDAMPYVDRRILWYGLGIFAALLAGWGLSPLVVVREDVERKLLPLWRRVMPPVGGALAATALLALINGLGINTKRTLGLIVGGYLLTWFSLAGLIGLSMLKFRIPPPSRRSIAGGVFAFLILWVGVGLSANLVWVPWLPVVKRLLLWPFAVLLTLPWFVCIGESLRGQGIMQRSLAWLVHSALLVAGFIASLFVIPGLGVLVLVLPLLPIGLGVIELSTARLRGSWPAALSGAMFLSWVLLAVFPMS
jgi:pimeloyl-ACP methyl ester carboxylesterase